MRILVCAFCIILTGILASCSGVLEPDFSNYQKLAISAEINGAWKILVIDCNDPSNFMIISSPDEATTNPAFSPDKRYISYFDHSNGFTGGGRLVLYDTYTSEKRDWIEDIGKINDTLKVGGIDVMWQPDSKEFYVNQYLSPRGHAHIDITKDNFNYLQGNPYPIETFVGYKNSETLIVRTSTSAENKGEFYYIDRNGEFLEKINNPYLRTEYESIESYRTVTYAKYYSPVELFVFSLTANNITDEVICVTNLDGSYFEVLTEGFYDFNPTLNHIDNIIYFERREWTGSQWIEHPIMRVSLDSKKITEFISINRIPGATYIAEPNF